MSVAPMLSPHSAHFGCINRGRPALVEAFRLSPRNALKLALATQVRLELGKHSKHVEEAFTGPPWPCRLVVLWP
jgi:hypothetical protein